MELGQLESTPQYDLSANVHCTDFFEVLVLREAKGQLRLNTQVIDLENSQFIFFSPFQKRQWRVNPEDLKGHFLAFEQDFLNDFFSDKMFVYRLQYFFNSSVLPVLNPRERLFSFKHDIFEEVMTELSNLKADSPHLLRAILYYVLIKLNRAFSAAYGLEAETQVNLQAFRFKEALEANIRQLRQVNEYADLLGLSRVALNTATKRQFGKTASAMLKERLVHEVKDALVFSRQTVAEIAHTLGFSEPQHLNRLFKQYTGQTPLEFRLTYQNGY